MNQQHRADPGCLANVHSSFLCNYPIIGFLTNRSTTCQWQCFIDLTQDSGIAGSGYRFENLSRLFHRLDDKDEEELNADNDRDTPSPEAVKLNVDA